MGTARVLKTFILPASPTTPQLQTVSMLSTMEKKLHLSAKPVSIVHTEYSNLQFSVFRSIHLQFVGLSALPLAEPIQHVSAFQGSVSRKSAQMFHTF